MATTGTNDSDGVDLLLDSKIVEIVKRSSGYIQSLVKRSFFLLFPLLAAGAPAVYESIKDICHPTRSDYLKIQEYIEKKDRPELKLMRQAIVPGAELYDYHCRARRFRLISKLPWQGTEFAIIPYNASKEDKRVCVVSYASYNKNYPAGINDLKKALKKVGFKGHFVYRIGGWPDVEGGSLKLAHVPYSFKPCFLRELKRLGYELVLWLDASIRPLQPLDPIFARIESDGYLFYPVGLTLEKYCTKEAINALGESSEKASEIHSVMAGIFGINLRHPIGEEIASRWYEAASRETPFFSPRPEQNALSILLHQMNAFQRGALREVTSNPLEEAQFLIDYKSVQ
ncbi:MAG: hypothetical protein A3E80_02655 [Chlamydiae bacterium RIFCSPHIGHO2_12_FULL_49_9]|nr:MAG: hypothetical protein A3E80_02655 [Chlamydiae bacterium RIFCSPHIGHO2_12_FULL_49_9]